MPSVKSLILRAKPYQESDLIVETLNINGIRQSFSAKNALKSRRRFSGGVLEPLHYVELYYSQRKSGIDFLHEGKVIYSFPRLRESYAKIQLSLHFVQLILMATRPGMEENKLLFDLIGNSLHSLEKSQQLSLLRAQFEIKFLYYLGFYAPVDELQDFVRTPVRKHESLQVPDSKLREVLQHTHKYIEQVRNL